MAYHNHRKKSPLLLVAVCALGWMTQAAAASECDQGLGDRSEAAKLVRRVSEIRFGLRSETDQKEKCTSFVEQILEFALNEKIINGSDDSDKTLGKLVGIVESRAECFEKSFSKRGDGMRQLVTFMSKCVALLQSDDVEVEAEVKPQSIERVGPSPDQNDHGQSERGEFVRQLVEINKELTEQLGLATSQLERRLQSESRNEHEEALKSANKQLEQQIRLKDEKLDQNEALIKDLRDRLEKSEAAAEQAMKKANATHDADAQELRKCRETLSQLEEKSQPKIRISDLVAKIKEMNGELARPKSTPAGVKEAGRFGALANRQLAPLVEAAAARGGPRPGSMRPVL